MLDQADHDFVTQLFDNLAPYLSFESVDYDRACRCYYLDTKTTKHGSIITGRAQCAVCIFCRKQIAAWGARSNAKIHKTRFWRPEILNKAVGDHSKQCEESWFWSTMARYSMKRMSAYEEEGVILWMGKLRAGIDPRWSGDLLARLNAILAWVLERLPFPVGTEQYLAAETGIVLSHNVMMTWPDGWKVDAHGTGNNPHVPLLVKHSNIAIVLDVATEPYNGRRLHMCPCGDFTWQ